MEINDISHLISLNLINVIESLIWRENIIESPSNTMGLLQNEFIDL